MNVKPSLEFTIHCDSDKGSNHILSEEKVLLLVFYNTKEHITPN
jgi:hypothetical protein